MLCSSPSSGGLGAFLGVAFGPEREEALGSASQTLGVTQGPRQRLTGACPGRRPGFPTGNVLLHLVGVLPSSVN